MIIAITGTPGTGKSELSERLVKKLKFNLVKVNELVKKNKLILGHDSKRDTDIVDTKALSKIRLDGKNVVEGHLAQYMKSDIIIVLRCEPAELYKRLKKRKWSVAKIRENLESECLGVILSESLAKNNNVYEIETGKKTISSSLAEALEIVRGKRNKYKPRVDYLEKITELDGLVKS